MERWDGFERTLSIVFQSNTQYVGLEHLQKMEVGWIKMNVT